ncbi:MAG: hypothetical protein ACRD0L_07455 [Acidimicrobiales bacterium]
MLHRWFSRRAVLLHLAVLVWSPGCVVAGWWQVTVAMSGNGLGWVYAIEWPVLAVFGVVVWWHLVTDDPDTVGARGLQRARRAAQEAGQEEPSGTAAARRREVEDERLAAYNDYLEALATSGHRKTWRSP